MLIIEIVLAIIAFARGWKFWALLPPVIGFVIFFMMGFFISMIDPEITDEEFSKFDPLFIIADIILIFVLIGMAIKGRKKQTNVSQY